RPTSIEMSPRCPGSVVWCAVCTGVIVGLRDFTQSRKFRRCSEDSYKRTVRRFSASGPSLSHSGFDASNPLRSTHTQPSVPIHFVPMLIAGEPPAIVILTSTGYCVTSFLYRHSTSYFVAVFHTAFIAGNSPCASISEGPLKSNPI